MRSGGVVTSPTLEGIVRIVDQLGCHLASVYHRLAQTLPMTGAEYDPAFYVAGTSASGNRLFKAAVYNSTDDVDFDVKFDGIGSGTSATLTTLTAPSGFSMNAVGVSNVVKTSTVHSAADGAGVFYFTLPNLFCRLLFSRSRCPGAIVVLWLGSISRLGIDCDHGLRPADI